jgi:hypothetical protein
MVATVVLWGGKNLGKIENMEFLENPENPGKENVKSKKEDFYTKRILIERVYVQVQISKGKHTSNRWIY